MISGPFSLLVLSPLMRGRELKLGLGLRLA